MPIQLGSHVIHLRRCGAGKGTVIVLVHGLGTSSDYFVPFAKALSDSYDVYMIDLPGYGKTPKPKKALTVEQLADVVLEFVMYMQLEHVVIVGQSMGCQIVAHATAQKPRLFQKAILLAPTVNRNERNLVMQGLQLWQDTFHEPLNANMTVFRDYLRMGVGRFIVSAEYMIDDHIEDVLVQNKLPILIVRGTKDKIVPRDWINFLEGTTPHSKAAEIVGAPHLVHYTQPDKLVAICRDFIATS